MVSPSGSEASTLAFSVEFLRGSSGSMETAVTVGGELRVRTGADEVSFPCSLLSEGAISVERTEGVVSPAVGFSGASPVQPTMNIKPMDPDINLLPAHISLLLPPANYLDPWVIIKGYFFLSLRGIYRGMRTILSAIRFFPSERTRMNTHCFGRSDSKESLTSRVVVISVPLGTRTFISFT